VVTAQDIQDKHLIALADIAQEVPNVVISTSSLFPDPTIRGVLPVTYSVGTTGTVTSNPDDYWPRLTWITIP